MICPYCGADSTTVNATRSEPYACVRRRECAECGKKFTTYEITDDQYRLTCSLFSGIDTLHELADMWRPVRKGRYG